MEYTEHARLLVADPDELFRSAIACLLAWRGHQVVGQAANGTEAVDLSERRFF